MCCNAYAKSFLITNWFKFKWKLTVYNSISWWWRAVNLNRNLWSWNYSIFGVNNLIESGSLHFWQPLGQQELSGQHSRIWFVFVRIFSTDMSLSLSKMKHNWQVKRWTDYSPQVVKMFFSSYPPNRWLSKKIRLIFVKCKGTD